MRHLVLAAMMTLSAVPAFAQSGSTQSPPSPNAASSAPTPATSAPAGAMTTNPGGSPNVGGALGSTTGMPTSTTMPSGPSAAMSGTVPTPASR